MDLLDAMCNDTAAKSVVEYSLAACFPRSYSTIFKAINEMKLGPLWLPDQLGVYLPRPAQRPFWLLMADVTPARDRSPTVNRSWDGVSSGSGERQAASDDRSSIFDGGAGFGSGSWRLLQLGVAPSHARVATTADKEMIGADQIEKLLRDKKLPFGGELTVEVADSSYSKPEYLHAHRQFSTWSRWLECVRIARSISSMCRQMEEKQTQSVGIPPGMGRSFRSQTRRLGVSRLRPYLWQTSRRGKIYRRIQAWHNLLMTGQNKPKIAMHEHPFSLVRIVRYINEGNALFKHPLWLIVMGNGAMNSPWNIPFKPTRAGSTWNTSSASANRS